MKITAKGLSAFECEQAIRAAMNTALRFQCRIYLVGSAIDNSNPLDIDIVMSTSNHQIVRLFGYKEECMRGYDEGINNSYWKKWVRFTGKQKSYWECFLFKHDVDFKIQVHSEFMKHEGKKIRLDPFGAAFNDRLKLIGELQ